MVYIRIVLILIVNAYSILRSENASIGFLDTKTQYDLDLVCAEKNTLSTCIDNTITQHGKSLLNAFLINPTDDINVLVSRQYLLAFLLHDQDLSAHLRKELTNIAMYEPALMHQENDDLGKKALERVYFSWKHLKQYNTHPYALDLAYSMHIAGLCGPLVEHVVMHIGIDLLAHAGSDAHDDHDDHHHHGCNHHHHHVHAAGDGGDIVYYGLQALHWGLHIPGLYDMGLDIQDRALMVKYIQQRMIYIAEYVRSAQRIHTALKQSYASKYMSELFCELDYFFSVNPACSSPCKDLLDLLKTSTFKGEASLLSHVGNVLAAYKIYGNVQQEFAKLMHAISGIDVYLGAAHLIEDQTSHQPWCFVTFSVDKKPHIIMQQVRNLFVPSGEASDFSSDHSARTLVMGDNGSGKSTYLMSIGHALVLAQTFGIAPATSCHLTPFSHIYTFRFIKDDFSDGISRFYAECARIEEILDTVTDAQFACVILDEPFAHTTAQKGAHHLDATLTEISSLDNVVSLVATHYNDLGVANVTWHVRTLTARV